MTSILCACAVHVLFMRYDVIVGIPLIAIWGVGGNLLTVDLTSKIFGLNVIPTVTKFIRCQTTMRTAFKQSIESITHF